MVPQQEDTAPTSHDGTHESNFVDRPDLVRLFQLAVLAPADGTVYRSTGHSCSVGSHPTKDLVLADTTVSRFPSELSVLPEGVLLRDLGSRNGSTIEGSGCARPGSPRAPHPARAPDPALRPDGEGLCASACKPITAPHADELGNEDEYRQHRPTMPYRRLRVKGDSERPGSGRRA